MNIQKATALLQSGNLVAIPTETVYGLAADITSDSAIKKIFELKGRPANHPLIIHISKKEQLHQIAKNIPDYAAVLIEKFWPGPLTLILQKTDLVSSLVTGGQDSVGVRMPNHPMTLAVIEALGQPVAAPSANKFGHISPTCVADVRDEFGDDIAVLDGGPCAVGLESTILDATHSDFCCVLREGPVSREQIAALLPGSVCFMQPPLDKKRVSGGLEKHYAPNKKTILFSSREELQGIKNNQGPDVFVLYYADSFSKESYGFKMPQDPVAYAHALYHQLREADHSDCSVIALESVPEGDSWAAVRDRLLKASG